MSLLLLSITLTISLNNCSSEQTKYMGTRALETRALGARGVRKHDRLVNQLDVTHQTVTYKESKVGTLDKPVATEKNVLEESQISRNQTANHIKEDESDRAMVYTDIKTEPRHMDKGETEMTCKLQLNCDSIYEFRRMVYKGDLSLVILHLNLGEGVSLIPTKHIVGETDWFWTFSGKHGGLQFLNWPPESLLLWSCGLLYTYVGAMVDMRINKVGGDCSSLQVGNQSTDLAISKALANLTYSLDAKTHSEQYEASYWCYKKRKYLYPDSLYLICKHIVCPIIALRYSCCSNRHNASDHARHVECVGRNFKYDETWYLAPVVTAIVLFSFVPLLLLRIAGIFSKKPKGWNHDSLTKDCIFLDRTDHVTLQNTLLSPLSYLSAKSPLCSSRTVRVFLPFLSLTVIGIQLGLDYQYGTAYVKECVKKAVPMGFRSMISGFANSRENFLPLLGGPYIACIVYLFIACFLLAIPRSLSKTLIAAFPSTEHRMRITSPLRLPFLVLEHYGSVSIKKQYGYSKIYSVYIAQLNLLINIKFWKFVYNIQASRWYKFRTSTIRSLLLPLYIQLCITELFLCILLYGFPIISFGITVFKAYRNLLQRSCHTWKPFVMMASVILPFCIVFFLFMFCTIFLDACVFLARLCFFTFTGIVLYPQVSYGYIIFVSTAFYYLWNAIQNFSRYYFQLLRLTVTVCESVQQDNDAKPLVLKRHGFRGVQKEIYEAVIEQHCPRRKKMFVSVFKVGIIVAIVGLSIHLLVKSNKFHELHSIMHVGTTLLICAFPKVIDVLCSQENKKIKKQKSRAEIKRIVKRTVGVISADNGDSDTSDLDMQI